MPSCYSITMAEELLRVDPAQGQGPTDLIIKLALQFLTWRDGITLSVVCKKWKELIDTDEVGRALCLNLLKSYEGHVAWRNEIGRSREENYQDISFWYQRHELLAKLMSRPLPHGRSYKHMFVLSERMGQLLEDHARDGPDVPHPNNGYDQRSLREASIQDYVNIVRPTIERLRSLFNYQPKSERLKDINEMKDRLLQHARRDDCTMLLRKKFTEMKKEELAEDIGRTMLMLATSNDLDRRIFLPSSPLASLSLRDAIEGLETIKGGEIAVQMSLQLNKSSLGEPLKYLPGKKKLCDGLYWPVNPVDSISFLIRQLFPIEYLMVWGDDYYDATEEGKEKMWDDMIHKFWLEMGEPMRQFLVTVFNEETDPRSTGIDHIPVDLPTLEVSIDTLKQIFELPYEGFREKVSSRIWREIDASLCEQIFEIYHQQAEAFSEAIQEEYQSVYSETSSLEYNAKLLLDIFLEVPNRDYVEDLRFSGSLTFDACDTFVERMEEAMDRWNELIHLAKTDEDVLWDPKTISELETFEPMFSTFEYRCKGRTPTLEFCVPELVTEFLRRTLSSTQKIPKFKFRDKVKKFWDDYIGKATPVKQLPYPEYLEFETRALRLQQDFRTLSTSVHTRHHAMIALVPLLPHLSRHDTKRLLYALFIQGEPENDGSSRVHSRVTFTHMFFRDLDTQFLEHLPCARGDDADFSRLLDWHRERKRDYINNYEVLEYIFGLPLPENIITAMGQFMVENLYREDGWINDVNRYKTDNLYRVKHFLVRFCYERPERAHIVWDNLLDAIEDAIDVVEGFDWWEINQVQRFHWNRVISLLVSTCIDTRAKRSLSHLRRLYQGTPLGLLYENFIDFRNLVKRIKEQPLILNDTLQYHQLRSEYHDV